MKFLMTLVLLVSSSAFATYEKLDAGYVLFPKAGLVAGDKVCFDQTSSKFVAKIPETRTEVCSVVGVPVWKCKEIGLQVNVVVTPAFTDTAEESVMLPECIAWNRQDSTRPVCTRTRLVEKLQPVDFTPKKYQVRIYDNYGDVYRDDYETEVRDIAQCNN